MTDNNMKQAKELRDSMIFALIDGISDKEKIHEYLMSQDIYNEANYDCEDDFVPQPSHICFPAEYADDAIVVANRQLEETRPAYYVVVNLNSTPTLEPAPRIEPAPKAEAAPKAAQREATEKKASPNVIAQLMEFMKRNYEFRYNVLTRQSEVKRVGEEDTNFRTVTKHVLNTIIIKANISGVACWDRDVKRLVESTFAQEYHPVIDYFTHLPKWDGKDRLTELAKRVSTRESWVENFSIWMRAWVAQMMNISPSEVPANCVAIILISVEQGWGKSSFLRNLLPPHLRRYYTERFNLASEEGCEKKLARFGLINIDEFDRTSERHMSLLKNIMQEQVLNVQLAYEASDTPLHRLASFAGTSNHRDLLTDRTGSRRFICVELERKIDCRVPIDYDQLFAQVVEEIRGGKPIYFDKEHERQIEIDNRPFYRQTPEEEIFRSHFEMVDRDSEDAKFMTASELYSYLKRCEPAVMRGVTAARFSRLLPLIGKRVHTKLGNGYFVVEK